MELKNPFGITEGKLRHVKDIYRGEIIKCPICKERLILKDGNVMSKHLAHKGDNNCNGESTIHKLAKQYIYENLEYVLLRKFKLSRNGVYLSDTSEKVSIIKKDIECRKISKNYIPDIMIKTEAGFNVAIEIFYKNKKDLNSIKKTLSDVAIDQVYEINVKDCDIENMNIEEMMSRSNLIYNKLEIIINENNYKMENVIRNNNKLETDKMNIHRKYVDLENRKNEIEIELDKYKNSDIDKLKWQIKMQKERISLLLGN